MAARKKTTENGKPAKAPVRKPKPKAKAETPVAPEKKKAKKPAAAVEPTPTGSNLVIVESPAKAKTIQKYLGNGYLVRASYGHIRDLPKNPGRGQIGIDIQAGWVPTYVNLDDDRHKQVLSELKKLSAKAPTVFLASDPDREGEAIAWHLKEALGLPDARVRRVAFNEITKRAIQEAFGHAGDIDMDRVRSQEARRFLDRAVGYKISPLLRKKLKAESAGRVQSVAVRLIVERELEIQAFRPEEYWKVLAELSPAGTIPVPGPVTPKVRKKQIEDKEKKQAEPKPEEAEDKPAEEATLKPKPGTFVAELVEWNGAKFQPKNETDATQVLSTLQTAAYSVLKIEQKDRQEKAPPPFTTSTLQQQANIRMGFTGQRTMRAAQRLYEGIDFGGEGPVALITYMRTDSTRVSEDALKACRDVISTKYGAPYLPAQPNRFASGKSAQEAHEAIRPTDLAYTPEQVERLMPASIEHRQDLVRLYGLIYRRFVASQMTPAVFAVTNVDVLAEGTTKTEGKANTATLKAQGKILKFDGYRKVLPPRGKQEDETLPPLTDKQKLDLHDLLASQHFTQPPPRYNEASLVKTLEKEGIGRPSTYASIIKKIQDRNYVRQEDRRFFATELGMLVTEKLIKHFPDVMDYKFTSQLEEKLDRIAERQTEMRRVLDDFWGPFSQALQAAAAEMEVLAGVPTGEDCPECGKPLVTKYPRPKKGEKKRDPFVGCSGYPECKYIKNGKKPAEETDIPCPTCGKMMLKREGKRGEFLGCSGYPECKTLMVFDAEGKPVLAAEPTEHKCNKCGRPMVLREGKRGKFLACSGYPECKNAMDVDEKTGKPKPEIDPGVACEKCGGPMKIRMSFRGPFLGCSNYPKCRGTKQMTAELREKLKDVLPPPPKKVEPTVEIKEVCPDCGSPMKARQARGSWFLGCTKYPKCKGTRKATPELIEQIEASLAAGATS